MRRTSVFALSLAIGLSSGFASALDMYRAGSAMITVDDPISKLVDNMGQPMSKEPVENKYGAHLGEKWYYRDGKKTVVFVVANGRIVRIEDVR
jgi:hypothetical protein